MDKFKIKLKCIDEIKKSSELFFKNKNNNKNKTKKNNNNNQWKISETEKLLQKFFEYVLGTFTTVASKYLDKD